MTRFVRLAFWSLENDRASPKSASLRFPSLSIRRFEPATEQNTYNKNNKLLHSKLKQSFQYTDL